MPGLGGEGLGCDAVPTKRSADPLGKWVLAPGSAQLRQGGQFLEPQLPVFSGRLSPGRGHAFAGGQGSSCRENR